MNKLKKITLGIIGATLVTVGIFACSNDELNSPIHNELSNTLSAKSTQEIEKTVIGNIKTGIATPLYNKDLLKTNLISKGLFAEIESIDLDYGYDSENNQHVAFFTIIGKNASNFSLEAFQAELIVDGNILIMPDPTTPDLPVTTFAKHSCNGKNCRKCSFERTGFLGLRIVGCNPCGAVNEPGKPGGCDHNLGGGATTIEIVKELKDTVL
ncbi:MAG: hypothetical protein REI96_21950 [Flavobacterium nitrogenifigens]|uniref:hypothetical protein n=1 Tax=Flavobacterium nitrogenifigens TaxID=1617283 RepID=UPI0028065DA2|nr:hypothetical protein [Flavobacterium nitrogenifigens]MDQ8015125.1 hypothetical protein [Flavobacterium nitrogenifigens]